MIATPAIAPMTIPAMAPPDREEMFGMPIESDPESDPGFESLAVLVELLSLLDWPPVVQLSRPWMIFRSWAVAKSLQIVSLLDVISMVAPPRTRLREESSRLRAVVSIYNTITLNHGACVLV